jgi:S1-C subfamily serine protease
MSSQSASDPTAPGDAHRADEDRDDFDGNVTAGDEHGGGSQQSQELVIAPAGPGLPAPPGAPGLPGADPWGYRPPGPGQPGYGQIPVPQPPRRRLSALISYAVVAALAACGGGLAVGLTATSGGPPSASSGLRPGSGSGAGTEPGAGANSGAGISGAALQRVEDAVQPGLVVINSRLEDDGPDVAGAAGTGMIISSSGLVLTNNHVIDATNGLTATVVSTGKIYPAVYLGYDKGSDVAVIKLDGASGLTPVPLGNSSAVRVGDRVVAMGNANGTGSITTVTGAITGLNQAITASDEGSSESAEHLTGMLQTDADIIKGDSGGPLVSSAGKVIGMDTASISEVMASQQNVGFAIPINKAVTIARQITADKPGRGVHIGATGFVGVLVPTGPGGGQTTQTSPRVQLQQEEQSEEQQDLGPGGSLYPAPGGCLSNTADAGIPEHIAPAASGALVLGVLCDSPAAAAGLAAGDVITAAAGQQVSSPASLTSILGKVPAGTKITVVWVTPAGQTITRPVTLAQIPPA